MEYNKLSDEIIAKLQALVGVQNVVTDAGQMEIYAHDEVTDPAYHHMPEAVVFAENGKAQLVIKRESLEDLIHLDQPYNNQD